jgi:opacity protein-like surface antigen
MIMKSYLPYLLPAAVIAFGVSPAASADYSPPIFVEKMPEYVSVEVGTGWYLRGDISYNFSRPTYRPNLFGVRNRRVGASIGFGYQFNDFLRAETSLAHIARDSYSGFIGDERINLSHNLWTGMTSGFVDLGTFVGITPYVGGGIGLAHARDRAEVGEFELAHSQYRFAYTLNAGAAYSMTDNLSLDVGYQFLHAPGIQYIDFDAPGLRRGVKHHQVRVGLRYQLW